MFRIQFGVIVIIFLTTIATIHAQVATPAPAGNTTTVVDSSNNATASTGKKKDPRLTGDPRKDYIYDPNLPRELNGYNLSTYPFYPLVPEDINFTCIDRHDGYYASIPHHCQLFHYCVVGVRYDFLCANFTVFDQTQFICQYVNIVNCGNSEKYYDKNNDLYEWTTTLDPEEERPRRRYKNRSKKRTTTSVPEYYDEEYYDYEEEPATTQKPRPNRQKPIPKDVAETQIDPEIVEEPLPEEQEQVQQPAPRPKVRPPRPVKIRSKAEVYTSTEEAPAADTQPKDADLAYDYEDPIPKEPPTPVEEVPPPPQTRRSSRTRGQAERKIAEQDSATLEEESRVPSRGRVKPKQADEELATASPSRNVEEKSAPAPPRRRTTTPATEEHLVEEHPVDEHPVEEVPPPRRPSASRRVATPEKARATNVAPEEENPRPRPVAVARPRLGRPKADVAADVESPLDPEYVDKQQETKVQVPLPSEGPVKVRVVQRRRKTTSPAPKTTTVSEYADYEQV
jgi:hypothetical protein